MAMDRPNSVTPQGIALGHSSFRGWMALEEGVDSVENRMESQILLQASSSWQTWIHNHCWRSGLCRCWVPVAQWGAWGAPEHTQPSTAGCLPYAEIALRSCTYSRTRISKHLATFITELSQLLNFRVSTLKTSLRSPHGYTENLEDWMCSQNMCYDCRDPQAVGLRAPSHLGSPRQLFWGTWPTLHQDPQWWRQRLLSCWTLWTDTSPVSNQL